MIVTYLRTEAHNEDRILIKDAARNGLLVANSIPCFTSGGNWRLLFIHMG